MGMWAYYPCKEHRCRKVKNPAGNRARESEHETEAPGCGVKPERLARQNHCLICNSTRPAWSASNAVGEEVAKVFSPDYERGSMTGCVCGQVLWRIKPMTIKHQVLERRRNLWHCNGQAYLASFKLSSLFPVVPASDQLKRE